MDQVVSGISPLVAMTADVVGAFLRSNRLGADEVPAFIGKVHVSLLSLTVPVPPPAAVATAVAAPKARPVVPVSESVFPDRIVCLLDGKEFVSMKRHLRTAFGLSPDQYRAILGLPRDYPMVCADYSRRRSELARAAGLGRNRRPPADDGDPPSRP